MHESLKYWFLAAQYSAIPAAQGSGQVRMEKVVAPEGLIPRSLRNLLAPPVFASALTVSFVTALFAVAQAPPWKLRRKVRVAKVLQVRRGYLLTLVLQEIDYDLPLVVARNRRGHGRPRAGIGSIRTAHAVLVRPQNLGGPRVLPQELFSEQRPRRCTVFLFRFRLGGIHGRASRGMPEK